MTTVMVSDDGIAVLDVDAHIRRAVRHRDRRKWTIIGCSIAVGVIAIAAWQLMSGRVIDSFWISSPSSVVTNIVQNGVHGPLLDDIGVTLSETGIGFGLGIVAGVAVGVLMGLLPTALKSSTRTSWPDIRHRRSCWLPCW